MNVPDLSIRRPVMTAMLIMAMLVAGVVTYPRVGINFFPNIDSAAVTIVTLYPGAGPETVESEVTDPIEESIGELSGVKELRSTSAENVSHVFVVFESSVDHEEATQAVRDRVARIVPTLPAGIESPTVERFDLDALPIMTLAVGAPGTQANVTRFARERVKEKLQTIQGVGSVTLVGGQESEVKVLVDPQRLQASSLAVTDVVGAIAGSNLEFPGGEYTSGTTELPVKVDGQFRDVEDIGHLAIMDVMGQSVRVGDVADVRMGLAEPDSAAFLDGERAVTLLVRKQSGSNAVAVADRIRTRLGELRADFPEGANVLVATDLTSFTKASFTSVQYDMLFGLVLCVLIVFLFLRNVRATLIAALAIPTSIVATVAFIHAMGFTFNFLTLMALTLCIGVLTDDAIVVLENIYRHMERGVPVLEAASKGALEIAMAVLATTISIVAVFLPVALAEGLVGYMLFEFGLTVSAAVLISLVVSFTLTPMMASRMLARPGDNWLYRTIERGLVALDRAYRRVIAWALSHRVATLAIATAILACSLGLLKLIGLEFVPQFDQGGFTVNVEMPAGTSLDETSRIAGIYAKRIRELDDSVAGTVTSVGADRQKKRNLAQIWVKLASGSGRSTGQREVMEKMRTELEPRAGARISLEEPDITGGGLGSYSLVFNLRGHDLAELSRLARSIAREIGSRDGFRDVGTTWQAGRPEVRVRIDHRLAASMGVVTATVGEAVRCFVAGVEASTYRTARDEIPIRVAMAGEDLERASNIATLEVRSVTTDRLVAVESVADVTTDTGPTRIDHQDRLRQVSVQANLSPGMPMSEAARTVEAVAAQVVPGHVTTDWGGQVKMQKRAFGDFLFYILLSIIVVYMVLATQFEHLLHPFTIMISLPFSLVGAFLALIATGSNLSIMAMFGMIMLMALVTKNAILLVDYTNTLRRRDGLDRTAALLQAGPTRLRPILMTAVGTIFGMLPVALSHGWGSELRAPMALCAIGGLATSTFLTLIVVPVVYSLLDDASSLVMRAARRKG
jgi:HAE1 family hydrophobic/amphiphilic exporter-1